MLFIAMILATSKTTVIYEPSKFDLAYLESPLYLSGYIIQPVSGRLSLLLLLGTLVSCSFEAGNITVKLYSLS